MIFCEQVRQEELQILHVLSIVFPNFPFEHKGVHVFPSRKLTPEHEVQLLVSFEQLKQEELQILQVLSILFPNLPIGQDGVHMFASR